jgi:hypothetical protein
MMTREQRDLLFWCIGFAIVLALIASIAIVSGLFG